MTGLNRPRCPYCEHQARGAMTCIASRAEGSPGCISHLAGGLTGFGKLCIFRFSYIVNATAFSVDICVFCVTTPEATISYAVCEIAGKTPHHWSGLVYV